MSKKHLYVRNERKTPTCETNEKLAHVQKEKKSQKKTPTRAERAKNTHMRNERKTQIRAK